MGEMRQGIGRSVHACRARLAVAFLAAALSAGVAVQHAHAAMGYELDASTPIRDIDGKTAHGLAVDQVSRRIYAAITISNSSTGTPGEIARFESNLSAAGTFDPEGGHYTGVAVNPVTQGFYAAQSIVHSPFGDFGTPEMTVFSSAGTPVTSFALSDTRTLPQIATDSSGLVYYPNAATDSVQVFNSAGALQEEVTCGDCPGGAFGTPVSVALDSEDDLYVADLSPDRVVRLTTSSGSYSFASVLQSGRGAAAVAVDPGTDDVLVGDLPNGRDYHIVAYDSSGTQFDDFGAGLFTNPDPRFGAIVAAQIAADATTHKLYVGELGKFYVFDKVTIQPPDATIQPATDVGQLIATLNATVNANGHAALECELEYIDEADFQANGFANATVLPCAELPDGSNDTALEAELSGLPPETAYRYRLTVASNAGSTTSGVQAFETLPEVPPTVTPEPPLALAHDVATLRSRVNPHGGSVSDCHFEFGTSVSYGSILPCPLTPRPATTDVTVTRKVTGLTPTTTYHYRLVVTSNAGTAEGEDVEFTTPEVPPPPPPDEPPPTAPPVTPPAAVVPPPPIVLPPPAPQPPLRCRKGFRKKTIRGKARCVRICRKGFRAKKARGKVRCVKKKRRTRAARRRPARADRR